MPRPALVSHGGYRRLQHVECRKGISISATMKNAAGASAGLVDADALASAFPGAEVMSPAAAFDAVPCGEYVRIALGSFELAAAARTAWT